MDLEEETATSEITILPDGRIYVFGMSQPVLEILHSFDPDEQRILELRAELLRCEGSLNAEAIAQDPGSARAERESNG